MVPKGMTLIWGNVIGVGLDADLFVNEQSEREDVNVQIQSKQICTRNATTLATDCRVPVAAHIAVESGQYGLSRRPIPR